jgi:hypothetical protein
MSAVQQMLLTRAAITVSGSLTGSSTLSIPAGVLLVSFTGLGGTGTSTWNAQQGNPSYPSGLPPYVASSSYQIEGHADFASCASATISPNPPGYPYRPSITTSSGIWPSPVMYYWLSGGGAFSGSNGISSTSSTVTYTHSAGDGNHNAYYTVTTNPSTGWTTQQGLPEYPSGLPPYVAGYFSYTTGPSTTATLNGTTRTWVGGYGAVSGTSSQQSTASSGAGQTITYSIPAGGGLSYSYTY